MSWILSLDEFDAKFPDEGACWEYLARLRWPAGFECPRCFGRNASFIRTRKLFECKVCRYQCSVTAGSLLHRTKQPLRTWFRAVHLIGTTKLGVSSSELQRKLGIRTYRAAWFLRRRVQHALRAPEAWLKGLVEVDEVYVGNVSPGRDGRGTDKTPVGVAVEDRGLHAGAMAAAPLPGVDAASLEPFVAAHVDPGDSARPGAIVKTDGWAGYNGLARLGYQHAPETEGPPERAPLVLPRSHVVAGNLKRMLDGTHGGRVTPKHLSGYVDEFRFRYNHRGWLGRTFTRAFRRIAQDRPRTLRMVRS